MNAPTARPDPGSPSTFESGAIKSRPPAIASTRSASSSSPPTLPGKTTNGSAARSGVSTLHSETPSSSGPRTSATPAGKALADVDRRRDPALGDDDAGAVTGTGEDRGQSRGDRGTRSGAGRRSRRPRDGWRRRRHRRRRAGPAWRRPRRRSPRAPVPFASGSGRTQTALSGRRSSSSSSWRVLRGTCEPHEHQHRPVVGRRLHVALGGGAGEDADERGCAADDDLDALGQRQAEPGGGDLEVEGIDGIEHEDRRALARGQLGEAVANGIRRPRSRSSSSISSRPDGGGEEPARAFLGPIQQPRARVGEVRVAGVLGLVQSSRLAARCRCSGCRRG